MQQSLVRLDRDEQPDCDAAQCDRIESEVHHLDDLMIQIKLAEVAPRDHTYRATATQRQERISGVEQGT